MFIIFVAFLTPIMAPVLYLILAISDIVISSFIIFDNVILFSTNRDDIIEPIPGNVLNICS